MPDQAGRTDVGDARVRDASDVPLDIKRQLNAVKPDS
jgi:hypothetical protein